MGKKQFKQLAALAAFFRPSMDALSFAVLVNELARICAEANPRFDRAKFMEACFI